MTPGSSEHSSLRYFTQKLAEWHAAANQRSLPWKGEKDPYRIWLSEVILQQTRALQGLPYYGAFTSAYPTVHDLAAAADDEVFRVWQGLGYYNRCRNMLATARYVSGSLGGKFPDSYDGLLSLKGIGPYTAAAISSFAFGLPHAVVDGNVYRVLARFFGIDTPTDTPAGKQLFASMAQQVLNTQDSAMHNQAIMDLGATVCTPVAPTCDVCMLQKRCVAATKGITALLPVRSRKTAVRTRYFNYFLLTENDNIWICKRQENDIWAGLYEPLLIETDGPASLKELITALNKKGLNISARDINTDGKEQQRLTHQIIHSSFYSIEIKSNHNLPEIKDGGWISRSEIKKLAFPKTLVTFFRKNLYF